MFRDFLA
ncbi:hypothetical protein MTR67_039982 [Solanum verrucosum]|nr:hypothetical protein MTR67_039982 [Solanum verrucosum]